MAALVADQLPGLAGEAVVPVEGAGTVNAIFRIGESVAARFPLLPAGVVRGRSRATPPRAPGPRPPASGAYRYDVDTNPDMADMGRTTLTRLAAHA